MRPVWVIEENVMCVYNSNEEESIKLMGNMNCSLTCNLTNYFGILIVYRPFRHHRNCQGRSFQTSFPFVTLRASISHQLFKGNKLVDTHTPTPPKDTPNASSPQAKYSGSSLYLSSEQSADFQVYHD